MRRATAVRGPRARVEFSPSQPLAQPGSVEPRVHGGSSGNGRREEIMAIQQGANVAELRGVAKQFDSKAAEVESIKNNLNALINNNIPANWAGRDADQFKNEWQASGMKSLAKLIEQLREASRTMKTNAAAQEQTSSTLS